MNAKDRNSGNSNKPGWRDKKSAAGGSASAWRKPGGGKSSGAKAAGASESWWQKKKDRGYEQALRRHRLKTAAWFLLSLGLVVGFLVWILWRPVRTPLLAVAATDYQSPLPPNAWAAEDIGRLHGLADEDIISPFALDRWMQGDSVEHWLSGLRAELDRRKPSGPDPHGAVIIYLSMHGIVNGRGEPCLLPPGTGLPTGGAESQNGESQNWLSVRRLLQYLFVEDRPARPSQESKKLLILDCNRIGADWGFGVLHNTFAQRLREVVEEVRQQAPNLAVLNSTGPGQIGLAAPELRGSVFGYYVASGLRGAADLDEDSQVTLAELHRYLSTEVNLWATVNRTAGQVPMLLPADADFALVHAADRRPFELPEYEPDPRWEKIARMWLRHAELEKISPGRLQPLNWQTYQRGLLRLARLVEAGDEYNEQFEAEIARLGRLADKLAADPLSEGLAAHSLPLAVALGQTDRRGRAEIEKRLKRQLAEIEKSVADPNVAKAKPRATDAADTPKEKTDKNASPDKDDKKDAIKDKAKPDGDEKKQKGPPPAKEPVEKEPPLKLPPGRLVESHFLAMLRDYLDPNVWDDADNPPRRALRVRNAAEDAAAPGDVRAQYWAWPGVTAGDRRRRRAEDRLFIGSTADLVLADRLWSEAQDDGYGPAQRLTAEVEKALRLCDDSWSKTVYLAAWLFARRNRPDPGETQKQLDALRRLVDDTRRLGAGLEAAATTGKWDGGGADSVAAGLALLEDAYFDECYKLRGAGREEQTLRGIAIVLRVPLLTGKTRNQLRQKYLDIAARRASDWRQIVASPDGSRRIAEALTREDRWANYLERLSYWENQQPDRPQHPVLSILSRAILEPDDHSLRDIIGKRRDGADGDGADGADGDATKADADDDESKNRQRDRFYQRQGALARRWLAEIGPEGPLCKKWMAQSRRRMAAHDGSAALARAPCAKAVRLIRAAAPLLGQQPWEESSDNPARLLRRIDLHYLMLWHAARSLDDFLGPTRGQNVSFFQVAAGGYLRSAKSLYRDAASSQFEKTDLEELLALRMKAAEDWADIMPEGDLSVVDAKDAGALPHETTVALGGGLPPGEAAFFVQTETAASGPQTRGVCRASMPLIIDNDGDGDNGPKVSRMGLKIDLKPGDKTVDRLAYSLPNTEELAAERYLNAVALYRGHTVASEFRAVPWRGVQIVYRRPPYQNPRVTVHGKSEQSRPIVFIFDCSMSMHNNRVTPTRRRIDVARDTLISILRRLAGPRTPYRIGMRIYAHRTGWIKDSDDIRIWDAATQSRKTVSATRGRHPNSDVELICRPRRFSPKEQGALTQHDLGWLIQRLAEAASHPMGETPLYLAIIQAMDDFPIDPGPKHIIAITDGLNDQYPDPNGPAEARKTALDVEAALRRHADVRLDIVGFDITDNIEELKGLTRQSNRGAFFSASNPKALLKALEESLQLSRYIVRLSGGDRRIVTPGRKPLDLNQPCPIEQAPGNRLGYIAQVIDSQYAPQAEMTLEGGEGIELFLGRDPRRLVYRRYTHNRSRAADGVADPLEPSRRFYIESEIPQWQGRGVRFAISVQNADAERFSPRPAEVWLQLKPIFSEATKKAPGYVFYNLDFQPHRPVPVLGYLASSWPDDAEGARLQMWFKLKKTPPDKRIRLADFQQQKQITVGALPGVTFSCSQEKIEARYRVTVTERHRRGTTDIYTTKVEIQPPPAEIVRRYSPEAGIVLHTFVCDDLAAAPIGQHEVLITAKKSLQADAVTMPKPMTIAVPDRGW